MLRLSTQKEAPRRHELQLLQYPEDKAGKALMRLIVFGLVSCLLYSFFSAAAFGFTRNECVSHLSRAIDPPYRLSPDQAAARCDEIALRIDRLSRQTVGKWQRRGPKGKIETMEISAEGKARIHRYNFATRKMEYVVQKWAIENPYGTPGEESLQFDEGTLSSVKFSGATMIITSRPASADIVERWTRMK